MLSARQRKTARIPAAGVVALGELRATERHRPRCEVGSEIVFARLGLVGVEHLEMGIMCA